METNFNAATAPIVSIGRKSMQSPAAAEPSLSCEAMAHFEFVYYSPLQKI